MSWPRLARFVLLLVAVTLVLLALMTLLPHDKYLRYQALNDGQAPTAYWVYERINHDPTPIDVALIGTSRTAFSIHSARMQEDLVRAGVPAHVANLHIVKMGRNMQYVIAKELLTHRSVKLLMLEMDEEEDRSPHPDFIYLADSADVLTAPVFINFRFFSDLARLPGRQLGLFADTQLHRHGLASPSFVPPAYEGSNLDHAEFIVTLDGARHERNVQHTLVEVESFRRTEDARVTSRVLPKSLDWLEYRFPRYYIHKILSLAAEKGTRVVFLYLPRYGAPQACEECARLYGSMPVVDPWPQMQDFRLWDDGVHMNWVGARRVTDYVAEQIVSRHLLEQRISEGIGRYLERKGLLEPDLERLETRVAAPVLKVAELIGWATARRQHVL